MFVFQNSPLLPGNPEEEVEDLIVVKKKRKNSQVADFDSDLADFDWA